MNPVRRTTQPMASIIIRAYNVGRFLAVALESVHEQRYQHWEALILDDDSDDDTAAIVTPFLEKDRRFRYIKNVDRLGRSGNLNLGLSLARGKYISILDGDDYWCSKHTLSRIIREMERNPELSLVAVSVAEVDEYGTKILRYFPNRWQNDSDIKTRLLIENCIAQNAVCFRRAHALSLQGYDRELQFTEDYDLWLRLGMMGKIKKLSEVLAHYRVHRGSIGVTHRRRQILEELRVVLRYRKRYPYIALAVMHRIVNYCVTLIPKILRRSMANSINYHTWRTRLLEIMTS